MAEKDIGALWLRESKNGNKYMSGVVEIDGQKHPIVIFKNKYKEQEKHPDYRIFPSQPRGVQGEFKDDVPF